MKNLLSSIQIKTLAFAFFILLILSTNLVAQNSSIALMVENEELIEKDISALTVTKNITHTNVDSTLVDTEITARRVLEFSQSVPFSLTAFTNKELEQRNATQLTDLSRFTPNLIINNGQNGAAFGNSIFIRGIGQSNFKGTSDSGVGIFLDGVYIPRTIGTLFEMEGAQVEVLRGPQGSTFGRNTIGGAINITTASPVIDSLFGSAELSVGNFNLLQFRGSANIPINKKMAANISTVYRIRDAYTDRVLDDSQAQGDDNTLFLRGKLSAKPSDKLVIDLGFDYTRTEAGSMTSALVKSDPNAFQFGEIYKQLLNNDPFANVITGLPYQTNATGASINNLDAFGLNGTAKLSLGKAESKLIIGHRNMNSLFAKDGDHSAVNFLHSSTALESISTSAELQFYNKKASKFNWLVGAYYMTESNKENTIIENATGLYEALEAETDVIGIYGGANNPNNIDLDFTRNINNNTDNNNLAACLNLSYNFSKKWTLAGGLRISNDDKTFTATHQKIASGIYIVPENTVNAADWNMLTGHFALEYQATEKVLTYLNFAHGFKSGGFSAAARQSAEGIQMYIPETARNLELGMKSDLGKNTRFNLSGFITDIAEIQTDSITTEEVLIQNRVKGEILGIELEALTSIGKSFSLNAFVGLTDARYTIVNPSSGLTEDSKYEKTPASQIGIGAAFSPQLTKELKLNVRVDYSYQDGTYHNPQNTAALYQPAFALLSTNIGLTFKNKYQFMIWAKNLTDEAVIQGGINSAEFGLTEAFYGPPRTFGATVKYKF